MIKKYLFDTFEEKYFETIEELYKKIVTCNNETIDLTILDTAGNYQFPAMRELAIKKSDGFILVYSIDNVPSFAEVRRLRDIIAKVKRVDNVPILVVGNKIDAGFRRIQRSEASEAIKTWGPKVQHIETSVKLDYNIEVVFNSLISMIDEQNSEKLEITTMKSMSRYRLSSMRASVRNSTRRASRKFSLPSRKFSLPSRLRSMKGMSEVS